MILAILFNDESRKTIFKCRQKIKYSKDKIMIFRFTYYLTQNL